MKTSTYRNDSLENRPAPETEYNRDFARICLGLHHADTIAEAESILVAAWHFSEQLDPLVTSITYDAYGATVNCDEHEAEPWARAAWRGFCRALAFGRLDLSSATIVPRHNTVGLVNATSITRPTISRCPPQPLHLSLEQYADELDSAERRRLACRPKPPLIW